MRVLFFILLSVLYPYCLIAQNDFCKVSNNCIQAGEELTFKVYYNLSAIWVPAGEAEFSTRLTTMAGRPAYHIKGKGATYPFYDWIFKVRDTYETYLDTSSLYPLRFIRDVNEGGYVIKNDVVFRQNEGKVVSNGKIHNVPNCIQDVLSSVYFARNINYNQYRAGAKIPFTMFIDDEVFNLYIRYLGKERITTQYGTFNAIKIKPLLIEGTIFKGGEEMVIWVSDDKNHLPLRVDSPILVGSIKVDLIKYKNIKHPLSSLVKKR